MPNGVFSARPPANGAAFSFASVWQPTQPAAFATYSPRFASPGAPAGAAGGSGSPQAASSRKKSPATAGLAIRLKRLLLLAELLVAAAAGLADRADLRLDGTFVAPLAHFVELVRLVLQTADRFLDAGRIGEDLRLRGALHAFRAGIEAVPGHAAQVVEEARVALHDFGVIRGLALRHGCERAEVLALQRHRGLALLHQNLGLLLREGRAARNAERQGDGGGHTSFLHSDLLIWDGAAGAARGEKHGCEHSYSLGASAARLRTRRPRGSGRRSSGQRRHASFRWGRWPACPRGRRSAAPRCNRRTVPTAAGIVRA